VFGKVGNTDMSGDKERNLGLTNPVMSLQPNQDGLGSHSDDYSDGELNSPESDDED